LVSHNLLSKPLLYMSAFFEANKNSYYQKLMQVRMNNELLDWLLFFLKRQTIDCVYCRLVLLKF
jgi:Fic family protein